VFRNGEIRVPLISSAAFLVPNFEVETVDLSNNDYIIRVTYKTATDTTPNQTILPLHSWLFNISQFPFFLSCIMLAFVNFLINER